MHYFNKIFFFISLPLNFVNYNNYYLRNNNSINIKTFLYELQYSHMGLVENVIYWSKPLLKWNFIPQMQYLHAQKCIITKCVLVHSGFHYILSEFWHFYLMKLFNPLVNEDQFLRTLNCFTSTYINKVTLKWNINLLNHSLAN